MKCYIETAGDPSVGVTIDFGNLLFDEAERQFWRVELTEKFSELLDERAGLRFEDECLDCGGRVAKHSLCGNQGCPTAVDRPWGLNGRVWLGVQLLDKVRPNWWANINVESLDIGLPTNCILGQLFENYANGRIRLFGSTRMDLDSTATRLAEQHGFYAERHKDVAVLTQIWTTEIKRRQSEPTASYFMAAARGAKFLDEQKPGWLRKINLATLDMTDPNRCVVKRVFGRWEHIDTLFSTPAEIISHGFDRQCGDPAGYPALQDAWTAEIEARRRLDK